MNEESFWFCECDQCKQIGNKIHFGHFICEGNWRCERLEWRITHERELLEKECIQ